MSKHGQFDEILSWSCKFCRVGPGNSTHRCGITVSPKEMVIKWWTGPIERERRFHARNILRASVLQEPKMKVTVHILTSPDSNGDSDYKQYDMSDFKDQDTVDTFAAAVNAIAFSCRPLNGRALIFVNPVSGSKLGPKRFKAVHHLFQLVGVEFDAITTTHHGHASEVVQKVPIDKYCAVISVSGDGTVNEIYTALIARGDDAARTIPLGIIPAGSEGTLAKMSTYFNPFAAAYVILKSQEVRPLDVLAISQGDTTTFAVCGLGWGIPGKVAEESEVLRSTYGRSRYAVSAIKEFVNWKGAHGRLEVLPAKERPLCSCGPGCLRCRSGASIALQEYAERQAEEAERRAHAVQAAQVAAGKGEQGEEGGQGGQGGNGGAEERAGEGGFEDTIDSADATEGAGAGGEKGGGSAAGDVPPGGMRTPERVSQDAAQPPFSPGKSSLTSGEFQDCIECGGSEEDVGPPENGAGGRGGGAGAGLEGEEEEDAGDLSMEMGACPFCETEFCTGLEGVAQPCPKCGLRPDSNPSQENLEVLRHVSGLEAQAQAMELPPPAHRRQMSEPPKKTAGSERRVSRAASVGDEGGEGGREVGAVGGSGVIAIRGQGRTEEGLEKDVVELDYEARRQGLGECSDRGSALLQLAQRWREEEEEAEARRKGVKPEDLPSARKKRGVWQRLEGSFLAVGCLNTEKISTPFVHMSDGCMDIIAVPAKVGRMELLSMGVTQMPSGGHLQDKRLFHWKATEMKFFPSDPADKFNVDGEVLDGLPISVKVLPSLARLISATTGNET